ncbi:MAG: riboflavin biosynthesis protein RibF [Angelakisella sp.]|nr:riboflavin biosynthesis protein RibF [Angelakisella sp.]MCI9666134.1 riboflavin biosynthesis protein RibF [Angelakisella sp.]
MLVTQDLTTPRKAPSSVALGFFDGVHAGHRAVIGAAVETARREGLTPRVFTFRPEGADASRPVSKSGLTLLQREEQKEAVLEELGVEEVICPPFETFRSMTPEQFVQGFLGETLHARVLVCGFNYHFGRGGQAGVEELRALCAPLGIQVEALPPVLWQGEVVSSTRIRQCIREGQIEEAAAMLCAPFTLAAEVVHGKGLARTLSWPTINQLFPPDFTIPRRGVYWSQVEIGGRRWNGITNVGIKPTLHETNLTMETYILDYKGDLYGQELSVALLRFLRPESQFASVQALSQRILADIQTVRQLSGEA